MERVFQTTLDPVTFAPTDTEEGAFRAGKDCRFWWNL